MVIKGHKFSIESGNKDELDFEKQVPKFGAIFQLNRKLFVCGGFVNYEPTSRFFFLDYLGRAMHLESMKLSRGGVSLSGLTSALIALGGVGQEDDNLKTCEIYTRASNKWSDLPVLNVERHWPGSVMFKSRKIFCFCGSQDFEQDLNSIESL